MRGSPLRPLFESRYWRCRPSSTVASPDPQPFLLCLSGSLGLARCPHVVHQVGVAATGCVRALARSLTLPRRQHRRTLGAGRLGLLPRWLARRLHAVTSGGPVDQHPCRPVCGWSRPRCCEKVRKGEKGMEGIKAPLFPPSPFPVLPTPFCRFKEVNLTPLSLTPLSLTGSHLRTIRGKVDSEPCFPFTFQGPDRVRSASRATHPPLRRPHRNNPSTPGIRCACD